MGNTLFNASLCKMLWTSKLTKCWKNIYDANHLYLWVFAVDGSSAFYIRNNSFFMSLHSLSNNFFCKSSCFIKLTTQLISACKRITTWIWTIDIKTDIYLYTWWRNTVLCQMLQFNSQSRILCWKIFFCCSIWIEDLSALAVFPSVCNLFFTFSTFCL